MAKVNDEVTVTVAVSLLVCVCVCLSVEGVHMPLSCDALSVLPKSQSVSLSPRAASRAHPVN